MMKKILGLGLMIIIVASTGCLKNGNKDKVCGYSDIMITAPQSEVDSVQAYLNSKGITATKHASGLFYSITSPGTGASINNLCSVLRLTYIGTLKNGTRFDPKSDSAAISFQLGGVIPGWQKSLPLIKEGGKIMLYIPPSLAYGSADIKDNNGVIIIPANSMLIFSVDLLGVSNSN